MAQIENPDLDYIYYAFLSGLKWTLAQAVINNIRKENTLDEMCTKTLKKAAIIEIINAIHSLDSKRNTQSTCLPLRSMNATMQCSSLLLVLAAPE